MAKEKEYLGESPLKDLFSGETPTKEPGPSKKTRKRKQSIQMNKSIQREQSSEKQRFTVHISTDLVERMRNAVFWSPGLTLSDLIEGAMTRTLDQMEKKRGEAFPKRKGGIRGRPVK